MNARWRIGRVVGLGLLAWMAGPWPVAAASARDREADWFKLVTPNFELFGNAREAEARRLLRELETFRFVVSRFLSLTNIQHKPALVFYFPDDASFRPFKPRFEGKPRPVSGFHVEDPLDHALALSRQTKGTGTMRVLFHEFTHLLTSRQFRDAPLWANEGVAEVFSTFESDGDRFDIGVALTNHVFYLHNNPPMSVPQLLAVGRESREYNEQERAGRFYATSWLLAHYLLFGQRGFETSAMGRYAALCSGNTNQFETFRLAFGAAATDLQLPLLTYLNGGNYTIVRQTYPDLDEARPRRVRLAAGELDYALGRLLQLTQQTDAARDHLERAQAAAPADPRPPAALALLAWRDHDRATLRSLTDAALQRGSVDPFVHYLAAEVRYQDLAMNALPAAERDEALREGRRLCERALELDPWIAPAHHLLGIYVLAANPRTPALAAVHVEQALKCDPQYKPAMLTWASLLAAQGNLSAARQVLATMQAGPLPDDLREATRRVSSELEKRAGKTH